MQTHKTRGTHRLDSSKKVAVGDRSSSWDSRRHLHMVLQPLDLYLGTQLAAEFPFVEKDE